MDCIKVVSVAAEGPQVNCKRCAKILRSSKHAFYLQGSTHTSPRVSKPVVENPPKKRDHFQLFPRMNPWSDFSWLTMEGALVEVDSNISEHLPGQPSGSLGACNSQKNCKDKSLTLKYFLHLWKHYIKQSRVQWLTLLLGTLVFSSPLLACNNSKLH